MDTQLRHWLNYSGHGINRGFVCRFALVLGLAVGCRPGTWIDSPSPEWAAVAVLSHAADVVTTQYGLSTGRYREAHPLLGESPTLRRMIVGKVSFLGLTYVVGEVSPRWRTDVYQTAAIVGVVPFLFNCFQLIVVGDI